ncbi:hypothetical protein [Vulcaniibacterium tengchongense]|uniref:Uncharacterized protein n=1 Tax=Vulcaniibacterium tengchongense TaxID=1273429 RepID=A0A3N4VG27_9GAMM|nr:hypothetical protein [Vulcaniibacterium tengchongense]RPE81982.1 hypothetical protein EDC50_1185 [Vulcaniibacterium tengchongense]
MSAAPRPGTPGATRTCPHCKTTILESASVCPACRHHLRFDPDAAQSARMRSVPLRVEGTIRPPSGEAALEYSVVLTIRNAEGAEIDRQVVGVGALFPGEERSFTLAVEATEANGYRPARGRGRH